MLKPILSLVVILFFFELDAIAQTTVIFDDETKMVLNGKLITTFAKPDFPDTKKVEQYEKSFYKQVGDTIEIATYGERPSKEMGNLYIYRFHTNELDIEDLSVKEELDDKGEVRYYYAMFNAPAGKELYHTSYNAMNSSGDLMSFSYFTVSSFSKSDLEALVKQVKLAAQTTVTFKDKSTYAVDGRCLGERKIFNYSKPEEVERIEKSFYKIDNDTIEISVYTEFVTKKMDELWVYRFHNNQLNTQELAVSDETQDDGQFLFYTINFAAIEGKFNSKKYTYENAKGEKLSLEFFNINSEQQEGLEALVHLITIN